MNVAYIETTGREITRRDITRRESARQSATRRETELAQALAALTEGGIEFEVVCSGTDSYCPDLQPSAAA